MKRTTNIVQQDFLQFKKKKEPHIQHCIKWIISSLWFQLQNRALAFEKLPNGPFRDRFTVDILKIDENNFQSTISPIEAKNVIYLNTWG
jgi:hypothetical protein